MSFLNKDGLVYLWSKITELFFYKKFDLEILDTVINKNSSGKVTSIVSTYSDAVSTTIFSETTSTKTITTTIVPTTGSWKYVKTIIITQTTSGKHISEMFVKQNK